MELDEIVPEHPRDEADSDHLIKRNGTLVMVERSIYTQKNFDEHYEPSDRPTETFKKTVKKKISKCRCTAQCIKTFLFKLFPFINILRRYNVRTDLSGDIVSGLTVGIMHIPQGMAYGMLTTLPPVYGLYASFFPVLIYFFLGTSRHISMGTFAVACLMTGSSVNKGYDSVVMNTPTPAPDLNDSLAASIGDTDVMSAEELDLRLQFAMSVAFLVGVIQLLMSFLQLGFITVYLSDSLISGFTTGAACHVFTSQVKHVFGLRTARYSGALKLVYTYRDLFAKITETNFATVIISVVCMIILYSVSRFINQNPKLKPKMFMPVPIELIVVVLGTVISYFAKFETTFNVAVVNDIPTGLPTPSGHALSRLPDVIGDAIALAIVIFAVSFSMGKLLAKKHDYEVESNQELLAYGTCMIISSFFSSVATSASLSRSLIQERVGGKTQIAGLVSSVLLLIVLLLIGPYFRTLPNCILAATIIVALEGLFRQVLELPGIWKKSKSDFCVLASIIIVALRGMFLQVLDLKKLWTVSIADFFTWIVAFLATVLLDVDLGLGVAVVFALITLIYRSQRPYTCILGQIPGSDIYRDVNIYKQAKELPGIKIFRFEQSLFFVNTEHFRTCLYKSTINPSVLKKAQEKQRKRAQKAETGTATVTSGDDEPVASVSLVTNQQQENNITNCFGSIILDCSTWSFVDSMGVKVLKSVIEEYSAVGIHVCLASCKSGIREMFEKTKFYDSLDKCHLYISVHDAVLHLTSTDVSTSAQPQVPADSATVQLTMDNSTA